MNAHPPSKFAVSVEFMDAIARPSQLRKDAPPRIKSMAMRPRSSAPLSPLPDAPSGIRRDAQKRAHLEGMSCRGITAVHVEAFLRRTDANLSATRSGSGADSPCHPKTATHRWTRSLDSKDSHRRSSGIPQAKRNQGLRELTNFHEIFRRRTDLLRFTSVLSPKGLTTPLLPGGPAKTSERTSRSTSITIVVADPLIICIYKHVPARSDSICFESPK